MNIYKGITKALSGVTKALSTYKGVTKALSIGLLATSFGLGGIGGCAYPQPVQPVEFDLVKTHARLSEYAKKTREDLKKLKKKKENLEDYLSKHGKLPENFKTAEENYLKLKAEFIEYSKKLKEYNALQKELPHARQEFEKAQQQLNTLEERIRKMLEKDNGSPQNQK